MRLLVSINPKYFAVTLCRLRYWKQEKRAMGRFWHRATGWERATTESTSLANSALPFPAPSNTSSTEKHGSRGRSAGPSPFSQRWGYYLLLNCPKNGNWGCFLKIWWRLIYCNIFIPYKTRFANFDALSSFLPYFKKFLGHNMDIRGLSARKAFSPLPQHITVCLGMTLSFWGHFFFFMSIWEKKFF